MSLRAALGGVGTHLVLTSRESEMVNGYLIVQSDINISGPIEVSP